MLVVTDVGNIVQDDYSYPVVGDGGTVIDVVTSGNTLSVTTATADNGTVSINADGTLDYQGNQDFNGIDTIIYTVSDGELTDTATVTVDVAAVNDQTTVTNSTATTDEDTAKVINFTANATDIDGDALVLTSASAGNGTIDITTGIYTPNANFNGTDTITYTVNDSDAATVTVTVNAVNDAPVANNDITAAYESVLVAVDVLGNDNDVEGDTLTIVSATTNYGSVTVNADQTLSYQIDPEFDGVDTITYTVSDGNGGESTGLVEILPALIQARNAELITKSKASIDEYGTDYTDGDNAKLVKFELWIDASKLSVLNASATEILGYQFDMDFDDTEFGIFDFPTITGSNIGFNAANSANSSITFNDATGAVAIASSTAIVDTDATNDGPPSFIGSEKLIGTFYMSPVGDLETMNFTIKDALIVTDTENIESNNYSIELEISSINATIQTDAFNYLGNISLHYFKDGVDTGVQTWVEAGGITFDQSIEFDAVKLSITEAYVPGIRADDAVALLKHIVFPETDLLDPGSAGWHAADANNDGAVRADDAVAILKHIVFPETDLIDTFDLINNLTGERITSLDMNTTEVGQWSIVANGDVNLSGEFDDVYTISVDIV
jgi:hypothetical protein